MEEQPQTPPNTEPVVPPAEAAAPAAKEPWPSLEGVHPAIPRPRNPGMPDRMIIRTIDWAIRNPAKALLTATALVTGAVAVEDFKSPDLKQPANVSHIDAGWWSGEVKMESGALLRAAAEKNQGIGILDNNHNREEIPKFLLDHVDDIAATKGIIFLERGQSLNEGIKKFYADGNVAHLDSFHFGAKEVRDTYIKLFEKCREKGVEILCYDRDGPMRDPSAQEYYSSPHYMGAGPRRGAEDSFPTSVPPELQGGEKNFLSERIADNHTMANFMRDTLVARGNPTDCTVYFVCGSYHFINPEIPKIETTTDRIRSFLQGPFASPQVKRDLDELVADILPAGPRKAVVTFDTVLPEKDRIPDGAAPEKYSITKNSRPLTWHGADTQEFSLKLPDAVFNRYLAQPEFRDMAPEKRKEALAGIQNTFKDLIALESALEKIVPAENISNREHIDLQNHKGSISRHMTGLRDALYSGDLDSASIYLESLKKNASLPLPSGARGMENESAALVATVARINTNLSKSFSPEILLAREIDRLEPPIPFNFIRTEIQNGPTGRVYDTGALPPDVQKILGKNKEEKIIPSFRAFITDIEKNGATPNGNQAAASLFLGFAIEAVGECRFQDAMCHLYTATVQSGRRPADYFDTLQCLDTACVAVNHAPALVAARAPKEIPQIIAGLSDDAAKELASITNTLRIEARAGGGTPPPEDPSQQTGRNSFADRFVEERRRPTPPPQEQTNGRTL